MNIPNDVMNYFNSGRRKIISVSANDDFTLSLTFDNNINKLYDMKEELKGDVFKPIQELSKFKNVFLDENGCVAWDIDPDVDSDIVWNNRINLCPDSCYLQSMEL